MKRIVCFLMLLTLTSSIAFADTLTVDLDTASLEELIEAKRIIDQRITEMNLLLQ